MDKIARIEDFKRDKYHILEIPASNNIDTMQIRVQGPRIMHILEQGELPNHLMAMAVELVNKGQITREAEDAASTVKALRELMDIYCYACMVEPKFEDVKEYMTDDQKAMVFNWGIGEVSSTSRFHTDQEDGAGNTIKPTL